MTIIAKPPRWGMPIVVIAVLYLAVQFAIQWRHTRTAPSPVIDRLTARDTSSSDSGATDRLISSALAQPSGIPPDSTEIKTGWRDEVRGVDLAVFTPKQRALYLKIVNGRGCTCGCGFTLAACRENDLTCPVSLPRVEELRDSVLALKLH